MYIVSITYTCDISQIEKHLNEHIEYLDQQYSSGMFLASGRKVPRTGGVILAVAESRQALEQSLNSDPFKKHNLANYDITEFRPSKTAPQLAFLHNKE